MKKYIVHIKFILLILVIAFLYGFAGKRNASRKIPKIDVQFTNGKNLFITYEAVNKLLIQKLEGSEMQSIESLFLNNLEEYIEKNKMIRNAEIYRTVDGNLGAEITQREPVLRVVGGTDSYYLDTRGEAMPLSVNYSARVPIVTGVSACKDSLVVLANKIRNDDFMKKQVIAIEQVEKPESCEFNLKTRVGDQVIVFGTIGNFDTKKIKLKAFYQKALADKNLQEFDTINLKFKNQVVCSKK